MGALPVFMAVLLASLHATRPSSYRELVQEDGPIEWATVAACLLALVLYARAARAEWYRARRLPWFHLGLVAFCVLFAGEELSWGQRVLAYRPPSYFLEHNAQQELNLHNLFKEVLRTKYLLMALVGVWGIALPMAVAWSKPLARALERWAVIVPPLALSPAFATTLALLIGYPWPYTGEVAECLFALELYATAALLFATSSRTLGLAALGFAAALAVGFALPPVVSRVTAEGDARSAVAAEDTARLAEDWRAQLAQDRRLPSGCGTHLRVFTWVREHGHGLLAHGGFAEDPAPDPSYDDAARRRYFLDPWNNPYWIWHACDEREQRVLFYSFGPNRRRDSSRTRLSADDVGAQLSR